MLSKTNVIDARLSIAIAVKDCNGNVHSTDNNSTPETTSCHHRPQFSHRRAAHPINRRIDPRFSRFN